MEEEEVAAAAAAEKSPAKEDASTKIEKQSNSKKRRRRGVGDDAYQEAYQSFSFESIPSTGRPGTPHRFFAESYTVKQQHPTSAEPTESNEMMMRVHQHANGLCIVTAGDSITFSKDDDGGNNSSIQWHVRETPEMSTGARRKRAGAMLKGKKKSSSTSEADDNNIGVVNPSDLLMTVDEDDAQQKKFPCCVFGSLLERNDNLTVDLLRKDPLLDGYLAVILPSGKFPPPPPTSASPPPVEDKTEAATRKPT